MSDDRALADPFAFWETLNEEPLLEAPRLRVVKETVRLQNGSVIDDYYQIRMGAAAVIAACRKDGRFVLLRMYKHGVRRVGLGFPGGGVEPGEDPLEAAKRELVEETGYQADGWRQLGGYVVHSNQGCGFCNFFVSSNASLLTRPTADDLEPHEFVFLNREEIREAVRDGQFLSMGHVCMATLVLALTDF